MLPMGCMVTLALKRSQECTGLEDLLWLDMSPSALLGSET
uniref:Uncharacterized protein n=1 Tax=Anguilla anguilla TaxID=7936 RepID=A0A0E9V1R2_ANGAN